MLQEYKVRLSTVACSAFIVTVMACSGDVEDSAYTHVIVPSEVVRFQADGSLAEIQDVAVAVSGEVWVLQRSATPHLFIFSADGDLEDSFGSTGPERDQLRNPYALLATDDARNPMEVWDAGNRRISAFNTAGRASVLPLNRSRGQVYAEIENHSYGKPLEMAVYGDNYLLMDHSDGLSVTADYLRSELLLVNRNGEIVDTLVDFQREFADSLAVLGREVNYLTPIPLWATCPDGELALLDPFTRTLRWYGADGTVSGTEALPIPVRELTDEEKEAFLMRRFEVQWRERYPDEPDSTIIANSIEDFMLRHWDQFSPSAPPAVAMMCRGGREVWLQEFSTEYHALGFGVRWLVHKPGMMDRVYVQFPESFRPIRFVDGRVYGVTTAEQGVDVVAYVSVPDNIGPPAAEAAN